MQSKRLHKESFLWNDLFHDKNKSEPIANRRKVRIYSLWWSPSENTSTGTSPGAFDYLHSLACTGTETLTSLVAS